MLKLRSSRKASISARLRETLFHWETNSSGCVGRPERRLQLGKRVVIEAEICGGKSFFQNRSPGEKRQRRALGLIRGDQQNFTFAPKKCAGDVASYVFGKADRAIVESDMNRPALQGEVANVVYPRRVQPNATQLRVQSLSRMLRLRRRARGGGRSRPGSAPNSTALRSI